MAILSETVLKYFFDSDQVDSLADDGAGTLTAVKLQCINSANDLVRSYLSKMYTDAQLEADNEIINLAAIAAIYYLQRRRGQVNPDIQSNYSLVLEKLRAYAEGNVKLADVAEVLPTVPSGPLNIFNESGLFDGLTALSGEGDS